MIRIADCLWRRYAMPSHDLQPSDRFMVWIDSVGGYRVCLGGELVIGQPDDEGTVDVPILADLSRHHARLRHDGDGYIIEAMRGVSIDGRPVCQFAWLHDGSRIQLGDSVRLRFRRPHPLSATVRLELLSRHRTLPSADAVLWMADSCVLGPRSHCHVVCLPWTQEVMLYRDQRLYCRTSGTFQVDGADCQGQQAITRDSRVRGDGFSFSLESLG